MFTLTPAPFDRLTALSLSKGSPLKGEGAWTESGLKATIHIAEERAGR